jgi:hypothetical protein
MGRKEFVAAKVHVRRCHVCGEVNEAENSLVSECKFCGKHLPSFSFFDESLAMGLKTPEQAASEYKSSALPLREYPPLTGVTVYWDTDDSTLGN